MDNENENVVPAETPVEVDQQMPVNPTVMPDTAPSTKKCNIVPCIIGILVAVILVVCGGYFYLKSINVYQRFVDKSFKAVNKNVDLTNHDTVKGSLGIKASVKVKDADKETQAILDVLNKTEIKLDYEADIKNKIMNFNLDSKYDSKDLVGGNAYLENGYAYIFLKDLYSKYIRVEIPEYNKIFEGNDSVNTKDVETVINSLNNAIKNSIKDEYVTKKLEGTNWKSTIVVNEKVANGIIKDVTSTLAKDDEFIKTVSKLTEEKEEDIKKSLTEVEDVKIEKEEELTIDFYTTLIKNDLVKVEISDKENLMTINIDNDTYDIVMKDAKGKEKANIVIKVKDIKDGKDITVTIKAEETEVSVNVTYSTKYNEKIEKKDVTNYVDMEKLTENDTTTILMNLFKNEGLQKIVTVINSVGTPTVVE